MMNLRYFVISFKEYFQYRTIYFHLKNLNLDAKKSIEEFLSFTNYCHLKLMYRTTLLISFLSFPAAPFSPELT